MYLPLHLIWIFSPEPPRILFSEETVNQTVLSGFPIELECKATGSPLPGEIDNRCPSVMLCLLTGCKSYFPLIIKLDLQQIISAIEEQKMDMEILIFLLHYTNKFFKNRESLKNTIYLLFSCMVFVDALFGTFMLQLSPGPKMAGLWPVQLACRWWSEARCCRSSGRSCWTLACTNVRLSIWLELQSFFTACKCLVGVYCSKVAFNKDPSNTPFLCSSVPPTISSRGGTVAVVVNEAAKLDCEASGVPLPSLMWLKDGSPVTSVAHGTQVSHHIFEKCF